MMPEDESDEAYVDEDEDIESAQSGGATTKGAINQGRTSAGNMKVAPEDSLAPADREELRDEQVRIPHPAITCAILLHLLIH